MKKEKRQEIIRTKKNTDQKIQTEDERQSKQYDEEKRKQ